MKDSKLDQLAKNIEHLDSVISTMRRTGQPAEEIATYEEMREIMAETARTAGLYFEVHPLQDPALIARRNVVSPGWVEGVDGQQTEWEADLAAGREVHDMRPKRRRNK